MAGDFSRRKGKHAEAYLRSKVIKQIRLLERAGLLISCSDRSWLVAILLQASPDPTYVTGAGRHHCSYMDSVGHRLNLGLMFDARHFLIEIHFGLRRTSSQLLICLRHNGRHQRVLFIYTEYYFYHGLSKPVEYSHHAVLRMQSNDGKEVASTGITRSQPIRCGLG